MGFVNLMTSVWKECSILGRLGLVAGMTVLVLGTIYVNLMNYHHWVEGGIGLRTFVGITVAFQLGVLYQLISMVVEMERD